MAGTRTAPHAALSMLLALLLTLGSAHGAVADGRVRYLPPTATVTATPIVERTLNGGDSGGASMVVAPPTATATVAPEATKGAIAEPAFEGVVSGPAAAEGAAPKEGVRPRPDARPVELLQVEETPTEEATAEPAPELPRVPRLDDPVLRWLPEIITSSEQSGTPAHIIAGVMRLESGGNPNVISPVGARGLMQIMPFNLTAMGVPEHLWHDPATNIWAGGQFLASRFAIYGSWDQAVGAYFGFGCDVFGTCTDVYISVVMGWASYFAAAVADPYNSGFALLPLDWVPPPIRPFVQAAPAPVETPPPTPAAPSPTGTPSSSPTPTPTPAGGTPLPGDTTTTPAPTEVPTVAPTPVPTEPPVEPTPVPTEPPIVPTPVPEPPEDAPPVAGTPGA